MVYFEEITKGKIEINISTIFQNNLDEYQNREVMDSLYTLIQNSSYYCWDYRLSKSQIEEWLDNFNGGVFLPDKEKRIALLMLLYFVHYNMNEVKYLCKELFENFLHLLIDPAHDDLNNNSIDIINNTYFYPLGNPSESGSNILYYFRTENKIPKDRFCFDLSEGLFSKDYEGKNIVIIDDMTCTGSQFYDYFIDTITKKEKPISKRKVFILVLIARRQALKCIKKKMKNIEGVTVISCVSLDKRSEIFSNKSYIFGDEKEYREECKRFAEHYGQKLEENHKNGSVKKLGYGNSQMLMGYFYNVPDNTLPIFWVNNDMWKAIFARADKVYGDYKGVLENDRTIKYV